MNIDALFSVQGRVALVTGGSSGIGRHIATGYAAAGAKVYICARTEAKVLAAAQAISEVTGGTCIGRSCGPVGAWRDHGRRAHRRLWRG